MARILVDLPDDQLESLATIGAREMRPRAALIRDAVAQYLSSHRSAEQTSAKVFGLWRDRAVDGVKYQQELREEW
ncbi:ribbon-helix-helix protein, CopG family [Pseudomonas sp. KNUC1026]|uniref:ribbon-helix-helix protein, CopG family n=1 Tax=Pseudomonas sp. KNUC1026 TaxID=2893890 RepID=UPI001F22ED68|nr:ribbon-helix-helix protein, CopG family [Pseudomonas sp. KNUC1026]UFH48690.1 ribbon-helix-helix protein, CopG family [Pseudomonas sp. KNUC1026]